MSQQSPQLSAFMTAACAPIAAPRTDAHARRLALAPEQAARCIARNAEAHSSALVAQVSRAGDDRYEVMVSVRNGTPYATARVRASDRGATAAIDLNVRSSEGNRQLVDALMAGC